MPWLAAAAAAALLNWGASRLPVPALPPSAAVSLAGDGTVSSAALWSLGMRRLAADLSFIRLLVYYGTHGLGEAQEHEGHDHGAQGHGTGYDELLPRCRRILALDPYWTYPVFYGAGALAFNQERPDEALALLDEGLRWHPGDPKLLATVAAVGFHKTGDLAAAAERLLPAVAGPDAPTMLKNMAAFMSERLGRREDAARLYREILGSRDRSYHEAARRGLGRLGAL